MAKVGEVWVISLEDMNGTKIIGVTTSLAVGQAVAQDWASHKLDWVDLGENHYSSLDYKTLEDYFIVKQDVID